MSPRDTRTGGVLEAMILPALTRGGYRASSQVVIGQRIGGRKHIIDVLAEKADKKYLISLKWQQVGGTAEQKVPFEVMCLANALLEGGYEKSYLVLGGAGWTLREFYTSGDLNAYLKNIDKVEVVTLEIFIAKANQGKL